MIADICLGIGSVAGQPSVGDSGSQAGGFGPTGIITPTGGVQYVFPIGNTACARPVINTLQNSKKEFTIQLMKLNGDLVDLTNVAAVKFRATETFNSQRFYIDKLCPISSSKIDGVVTLALDPTDVPYAGIWVAGFQLFDINTVLLTQYNVYLYVAPGIGELTSANNCVTIAEVRMAMLDRCTEENNLLDDFEFGDAEMAFAINRIVDMWNEMPPIMYNGTFTPATFPYRYNWIEGAVGELYRMASRRLLRNKLDYAAGGINVQDRARGPIYAQMSEQIQQKWTAWARAEKVRVNAENCYGNVTSKIYF